MWCTQCHTAFSWRTGNIERNIVHNPHFYEWQRNNNGGVAPRVPGDVVCGGLTSIYELERALYPNTESRRNMYYNPEHNDETMNLVRMYHRIVAHVQAVELRTYQPRTDEEKRKKNVAMRIKWMLNELDEKTWKQQLYYQEKRDKFRKDVFDVFDLFGNAGQDILRRIGQNPTEVRELLDEFEKLVEYVNKSFEHISKANKYSTPYIHRRQGENRQRDYVAPDRLVVYKKVW